MTKSFKSLTQDARLDLLIADAQIALTLLESAELTSDDAVRTRHIEEAQKAYLIIMLRLPNLSVDEVKLKPRANALANSSFKGSLLFITHAHRWSARCAVRG